jgi:hypothetical protein
MHAISPRTNSNPLLNSNYANPGIPEKLTSCQQFPYENGIDINRVFIYDPQFTALVNMTMMHIADAPSVQPDNGDAINQIDEADKKNAGISGQTSKSSSGYVENVVSPVKNTKKIPTISFDAGTFNSHLDFTFSGIMPSATNITSTPSAKEKSEVPFKDITNESLAKKTHNNINVVALKKSKDPIANKEAGIPIFCDKENGKQKKSKQISIERALQHVGIKSKKKMPDYMDVDLAKNAKKPYLTAVDASSSNPLHATQESEPHAKKQRVSTEATSSKTSRKKLL